MCEFCTKHGDGKKWYLQAKNYSEDLTADVRRQRATVKWFNYFRNGLRRDVHRLETVFPKLPRAVRRLAASLVTTRQKREHFGQVVPIDDIERIFEIVNSVVRVPCVCREVTLGREVRYCLGISAAPNGGMLHDVLDASFLEGPDTHGMDELTGNEALQFMRELEKQGAMHSVWTFGTPFIGGICNCNRQDCVAMRATVNHGVKVMFKAEYVAELDKELCTGCRECVQLCQFDAIGFSSSERKACINPMKCYGCGVCRSACSRDAISLRDRSSIPVLAQEW